MQFQPNAHRNLFCSLTKLFKNSFGGVAKTAEWEDPELTSSYRHRKCTTSYRTTLYENDVKTSRKDFPRLKM